MLPEESEQLYAHAREPKKLVTLHGYGHYEVYQEPAFSEVMSASLDWFNQHLPPRSEAGAKQPMAAAALSPSGRA